MATTRLFFTRLLRVAVSHRPATTTLLRPHHTPPSLPQLPPSSPHLHTLPISNLHFFSSSRSVYSRATTILFRPHHTPPSPPQLPPSSPHLHTLPSSNIHFFSTYRSVYPRATKSKRRSFLSWTASVLLKGTLGLCLVIFLIWGLIWGSLWGLIVIWKKILRRLDDETGTKFKGLLPDRFRKGHSIVFDGNLKLLKEDNRTRGFKWYFSATEVLTELDQLAAAMEKNKYILAEKLYVAEQEKQQNVAGEEPEAVVKWCATPSDKVSLVLEGRVKQSRAFSLMAGIGISMLLFCSLDECEGLRDGLHEGHSFVVDGSLKLIKNGIKKEDESGKSVAVKVWGLERHLSAEVFGKHVKYMPQDAGGGGGGIEEEEN